MSRKSASTFAQNAKNMNGYSSRQRDAEIATLRERFESLSARVRQVVAMVVSGRLNKQIAAEIGTTENTVKFIAAVRWKRCRQNLWLIW